MLSHHSAKVDGHGHCDSGDAMVLLCHAILQGHVTKRLSNSIGRKHARQVTILPSLVVIGILVWGLWKPLMESHHFGSLPSLVAIGNMVVEICC